MPTAKSWRQCKKQSGVLIEWYETWASPISATNIAENPEVVTVHMSLCFQDIIAAACLLSFVVVCIGVVKECGAAPDIVPFGRV